jgi:acyl carrier protein
LDRQESLGLLREAVADVLAAQPDAVTEQARFREDLGADSLDLIEIVTQLEERTGIPLPQAKLEHINTVAQALDLLPDGGRPADGA